MSDYYILFIVCTCHCFVTIYETFSKKTKNTSAAITSSKKDVKDKRFKDKGHFQLVFIRKSAINVGKNAHWANLHELHSVEKRRRWWDSYCRWKPSACWQSPSDDVAGLGAHCKGEQKSENISAALRFLVTLWWGFCMHATLFFLPCHKVNMTCTVFDDVLAKYMCTSCY